jgi:hypothetical protein
VNTIQLSDKAKAKMYEYGIPEYMHGGLIRYFENRLPPGDFLQAVLSNDLFEAFARADEINTYAMKAYVVWLVNQVPGRGSGIWGSREAVKNWLEGEDEDEEELFVSGTS